MSSAKCLPSCSGVDALTHWGRVTHICISKLNIIGSDNGLAPGRRQAIIWTNAGILLIGPLRTNFSEILVEINTSSYMKMHLKMSSGKWRPFYIGLSVVTVLTPLGNETWPAPPPNHSRPLPPPSSPIIDVITLTRHCVIDVMSSHVTRAGVPVTSAQEGIFIKGLRFISIHRNRLYIWKREILYSYDDCR